VRHRNLQSLEHEVEQLVPALKQEVARQRLQVLNKGVPGHQGLPHPVVLLIRPSQHRMEQKCSAIQREQHGRQVLFSMAIVMFEMIAFGFKDIDVLVLNFPTGSSGLHDCFHVGAIHVVVRRKRMAIQNAAVIFFGNDEFTPIDP